MDPRLNNREPVSPPRLERAWASLTMEIADVFEEHYPELRAEATWVAGGIALFAGVQSPLSQVHGLGFERPITHDDVSAIERFYAERESHTTIDACLEAHPSLIDVLRDRDYEVVEEKHVLSRPLRDLTDLRFGNRPSFRGILLERTEDFEWAHLAARGFYGDDDVPEWMVVGFRAAQLAPSVTTYMAYVNGQEAAGAAMGIIDETAVLFSTSVLPAFRGRGVQQALIEARLYAAQRAGCEVAMVFTAPWSISQRNLQRWGFQHAYQKWKLIGNIQ